MRERDRDVHPAEASQPDASRILHNDLGPVCRAATGSPDAAGLLGLQRMAGNAAVSRLMSDEQRSPALDVVESGGTPLDEQTRTDMESRLGHDFSDVRVHTDSRAHDSARAVDAYAYTVGSDIVFQRGMYDSSTHTGKVLLAHELTHVVQQRRGPVDGTQMDSGIWVSDPADRFEREAAATAERAVHASEPAADASRDSVSRQTVASAHSVQRVAPPGSAAGQADAAVGGTTAQHELTASVTIAGGQTLYTGDGKIVHTVGDTSLRVSVTTGGLFIDLRPALIITNVDAIGWIDVDIDLHRLSWDFGTQMLHAEWTAANAVNWFGGVGDKLFSPFRAALDQLPARTSEAGYNPFTDENLPADLTALVGRLARAGGSGSMPRMSGAQLQGELAVSGELSRNLGHDVTMVVPSGTRLSATAILAGDVPDSAARVRIAQIRLDASGGGANINLRALGQDWPVIRLTSVTMIAGGQLSANYVIIHEDIGSAVLQLLAAGIVQQNPLAAGEIREDLTVRDQAAHRMIDQMVRDNIEPALRDAIRSNANAIRGINLTELLGVSP